MKTFPTAKRISLALALALIGIQFVRPEKPAAVAVRDHDAIALLAPPPEIGRILVQACYDCHSNQTAYPWYAKVQPIGWIMSKHIREGRHLLNFSELGRLPPKKIADRLEDCADEVAGKHMPLPSYRLAHPTARLGASQIDLFVKWSEDAAEDLRRRATSEDSANRVSSD